MSERITLFAEVLLPLPLPKLYTYRVPFEWNEWIKPGLRVAVPFGVKKVYSGIVWTITEEPPEGYQANYILEILDEQALLKKGQMQFWEWIARYYMSPLGEVMQVALPAGYRVQSQTKISLHPEFQADEDLQLDEKENQILSMLLQEGAQKVEDIQKLLDQKSVMKLIKSLYIKGVITMEEELKQNYKPKWLEMVAPADIWENEDEANRIILELEKRAPKQYEAMLRILGKGFNAQPSSHLCQEYDITRATLKSLEKKEFIRLFKQQIDRYKSTKGKGESFILTEDQSRANSEITHSFDANKHALLFGVTGSGKTLLYIEQAKSALSKGRQVLFLVPEVALTENLVSRISEYLETEIGVWHHYYSPSERTELYQMVQSREIQFLIGTRTAVFAPFVDLGLIIIDEEHEQGYKQFEKRPHFHARDAAFFLAKQHEAHILLGSATPSYEMWSSGKNQKLTIVELNKRYEDRDFAQWHWLNLKVLKQQNRYDGLLADPLKEAISLALNKQEKVILYHNRKGYAPYIQCTFCGNNTQCVQCDITLTYYKSSQNQRCNYCGFQQDLPKICPGCGGGDFTMKGAGTEKWVEELQTIYPDARIARFDQQSIRKRSDFQRILTDFENGHIDILVGTQLLAKGIDFENVSLIAVPDGDMALNIPDFRSNERAFQQLYQLAGRAGRGKSKGNIFVQTYRSNHRVFEALEQNDFRGLASEDLEGRMTFDYPPFGRLIEVRLRHKEEEVVINSAMIFNNLCKPLLGDSLLGPITPSVAKVKNQFIRVFMVKFKPEEKSANKIKQFLWSRYTMILQEKGMNGLRVDFDVDPY